MIQDQFTYFCSGPVTVYARLTRGGHTPVLNARVKATLFKPGAAGEVILDLNDNGAGYPDVTADDGIYSAYFSDFAATPGLYSIRVEADNNDGLARTPKMGAAFSSLNHSIGASDVAMGEHFEQN